MEWPYLQTLSAPPAGVGVGTRRKCACQQPGRTSCVDGPEASIPPGRPTGLLHSDRMINNRHAVTTHTADLFPSPSRHPHSDTTLSRHLYINTSLKVVHKKGKTKPW